MASIQGDYIQLSPDEATYSNGVLSVSGSSLSGTTADFPLDSDTPLSMAHYPIYFDGVEIFRPETWEEASDVIESVNQTEAGTDQIIVTRYDKLSVSTSFKCSSVWARRLKAFSKRDTIAVKMYDILDGAYKTRPMRIREFRAKFVHNSYRLSETTGVWEVSFTLKEL